MTGPELSERHERVVRALRTAGPVMPDGLERRVELAIQRPPRRAWRLPAMAAATVAAAIAIAAVVVLPADAPNVRDAAGLVDRATTERAPPGDPAQPALLDRRFAGVAFPDWSRLGWMADGARRDRLEGRATDTVYYTHHGHVIAYTVVDGEPLEPPDGATTEHVAGLQVHRFRDGHRDVVTFERNGRTCVLAGHVISSDTIVRLAAWNGDGAVRG